MKIGLLNPWTNAAENQVVATMIEAARRMGHEAHECTNTQDILDLDPDFVFALASTQPKLTNHPTYGSTPTQKPLARQRRLLA